MMVPDQQSILEVFQPLFPSFVAWWRGAHDDYVKKFSEDEQRELGPSVRAMYMQKMAVSRMRTDPLVVGRFRPGEGKGGLEFLRFDAEPVSYCVLLKKTHVWGKRYRTSGIRTQQQNDRRIGPLLIQGAELYPLVVGSFMRQELDGLWTLDRVVFGHESNAGFDWVHKLWSREDGDQFANLDAPLPMFPPTKVTLREPIVPAAPNIAAVGTEVQRQKEQRERREAEGNREAQDRGV